jgi:aquaporin NIP
MRRKLVAEFIGTFALVFCGTGAIIVNQETSGMVTHVGIAITFGLIILAMIFTFGEISGAHFNPAVTVGFSIAKTFSTKLILPYISSQLAGALTASLILKFLFPENELLGCTIPAGSNLQSFLLELIMTFLLMIVILSVSKNSKESGLLAGIAVGATILLEAMFGGPVSGASMNPVRSLAPAIVSNHFQSIWIYLTAPFAGTISAGLAWIILNKEEIK